MYRRLEQLEAYLPPLNKPSDFTDFWTKNVQLFSSPPLNGQREELQTPFPQMKAYKIQFASFDGTTIVGFLVLPHLAMANRGELPCLIHFPGYTATKGYPEDYARWLLLGCAVLTIDIRGQCGETGSNLTPTHGQVKGWVTQGILSKEESYYRAIIGDCYRTVEWALQQREVDSNRIGVMGASQGGGLALWTAVLHEKIRFVIASIPNMCHLDKGVFASTGSLTEVADFIHRFPEHYDTVMQTLTYFDFMNIADHLNKPLLASVGLKDTICLPETVYGAYNRVPGRKEMHVYPFSGHYVGGFHYRKMANFVAEHISDDSPGIANGPSLEGN